MCQTSEISGSGSPVILGDTSPEWLKTNVIDYVNSLNREFIDQFPESLIHIKQYALSIVHMEKQLSGKNWETQKLYFLNEKMLVRNLTVARKEYAESIKALSADWRITPEQNWSFKDTLRCAVIQDRLKTFFPCYLSAADVKKYIPVIYSGEKLIKN